MTIGTKVIKKPTKTDLNNLRRERKQTMRIILAIDGALLKFFGKIARAFARLTGRSNFFLAKCMMIIVVVGFIIATLNYWFPILGRKTNPITAGVMAFGVFTSFSYYFPLCDRAEETTSYGVKMFNPLLYSPFFRIAIVFGGVIDISIYVSSVIFANEFLLAKLIDGVMGPAYAAFLYFVALDPPRVDKSKIREWAEGFASIFYKPAAVTVKKK